MIHRARRAAAALAVLALVTTACGSDDDATDAVEADSPAALSGLLAITAGECADGAVTSGSYFRMVQSGGTVEDGPFIDNPDSPCGDTTWTPLTPGTDGGLTLGEFQPLPDPIFDEGQNALANAIVEPQTFFAVDFGVATNPTDPQTETGVDAPALSAAADGSLSGDVSAFAAAWNNQHFNQGAPKPDGSLPEGTRAPTGTYDADSGAVMVEWTSLIVGGPFDGFTGVWHLEGTLT